MEAAGRVTELVLGPLLRHVGARDATIWVETSAACDVEVRAGTATATDRTFHVAGHHYAIVALDGLEPGSSTPYEVLLDGERVWPTDSPGDSRRPPSRIRTLDPGQPLRLAFGSCREPAKRGRLRGIDPDVLVAYAERLTGAGDDHWPSALLLVGDQVYADDTSPAMREGIRRRRDPKQPPGYEVANFEEYTQLYREAWTEPIIRWLFSTVPVSMIFDDHDIRDDWNTSHAWRLDMQATDWWEERITGGLMAYWIYQHLGNLSPAGLADNEILRDARAMDDAEPLLRAFAQHADREADGAKGTMWSYRRDLGRVRLLVIDSRCGRILADNRHLMIGRPEFEWIEQQVEDSDYDHLVVGTSLPWLLPRTLHEIESLDESLARPSRGRLVAGFGEWLRRAVDLEHWAAFRSSFDRLAALFARIGRGEHGTTPPATICILSGDVHHTYTAVAAYPDRARVEGRPDHLLAVPQHDPAADAARVPDRVELEAGGRDAGGHPAGGREAAAPPLAPSHGPRLRQRAGDAHARGPGRTLAARALEVARRRR
jgi:phosphodiesterase/alkaline phosphatase D-like protein